MTAPVATPLWSRVPHAGYYINSVATSANGGRVVAGTFFHVYGQSASAEPKLAARMQAAGAATDDPSQYGVFGTYVWDRAGTLLMQQTFQGWQGVYWVAMAGDGSIVASTGWKQGSPDYAGFVGAWSVDGGTALLDFALPGRGNVVALDQDAQLLLAGADKGYLFFRNGGTSFGATPATLPLSASGDTALVTALSADGRLGMVASYQGELLLFPIVAGQPGTIARWQVPGSAYLHFAALSADGRRAYLGANNGMLYAIDVQAYLASPGPRWQVAIPGGAKTIYGVACSANGARVAVAGNLPKGGTVSMFEDKGAHGALIWSASTQRSPNDVSFDASGRWLALADGHPDGTPGNFYLWDADSGALQWTFPTSDMSWPIQLSADASTVVAGSDNGSVYLFQGPAA